MLDPHEAAARLADMRRVYETDGLDVGDLAAGWLEQFERWLAEAIDAGLTEANAMVLATADAAGRPSARTVLLKGVDDRGFVLYTNLSSRKAREAAANPRAALVFPWLAVHRQVVVDGTVEVVPDAEADAYFARRPRGAQLGAHASAQSQPIASREALEQAWAAAAVRVGEGQHVPRPPGWGGLRVRPDAVEFWQGRRDRLHDRLRFRREAQTWRVERLAP